MPDRELGEYILGTDGDELRRLQFQHVVWTEQLYELMRRVGPRAGDHALDLGSGPGFTSVALARVVGPRGKVFACDTSRRFLAFLEGESKRLGLEQLTCRVGDVGALDVPPSSIDFAYARWLFCWLPDATPALKSVHKALKPGGVLAMHEYLDWSAMTLMPRSPIFDHAIDCCMQSWREGGATIDFVREVPRLASACGFAIEELQPIARVGRVGSLEWRWMGEFFESYLRKLVGRSRFESGDFVAFQDEWKKRERDGSGFCLAPTMASVVLRKLPRA
ncbi:MAG: methyltransferase domain-containing protein [Planctomycetota bacterium]